MSQDPKYESPFSWRYASSEMRQLWSEQTKRLLWRRMWVALVRVQAKHRLATPDQVKDLENHAADVDLQKSAEVEGVIRHDLAAELKVFASQSPIGGSILHQGATSMDIEDNAEAFRIRSAIGILLEKMRALLFTLADCMDKWADLPVMGSTHLQAAEPTTLGYRLAFYTQDLFDEYQSGRRLEIEIKGKGFTGAVGTGASYGMLVGMENLDGFEAALSEEIGLPFYPITSQVYPRRQDYKVTAWLAEICGSLHKAALDLRLMQSSGISEVSEAFADSQVGSSAMPFKHNPVQAEKLDSLARFVAALPAVAWENFAFSMLERTLDDSANRRLFIPEAFLAVDEILLTALSLFQGLTINEQAIRKNLSAHAPLAATERILLVMTRRGADRQAAHEHLRRLSQQAWEALQNDMENPLPVLLRQDAFLIQYIHPEEFDSLLDIRRHTGFAAERSHALAAKIRETISK